MRLSHADFDAFQRIVLELYEQTDFTSFRARLPVLFRRVIPADHFCVVGYNFYPKGGRARLVEYFESDQRLDRRLIPEWERLVWEHPFTHYFLKGEKPTALMFSDFMTLKQLRKSIFWETICTVLEYDRNLTVPVHGEASQTALSLGRRRRDFTERDRLLMNLIRPHFNQACQNAIHLSKMRPRHSWPIAEYRLTPRETEIAKWVAQGKANPEIAIILHARVRTVEKHLERILDKLHVENRCSAAVLLAEALEV